MNKILVVEDDKFLGNAYRIKLEKQGFEVTLAVDGNEVLRLLASYKPELIILDLVMPGMDGFAVLAAIKKVDNLKNIPVIVASNLGQKEDIDRAISLGADDYVVKSDLSMADLIEKIKTLLPTPQTH